MVAKYATPKSINKLYQEGWMLSLVSVGVWMRARTLAAERHNGKALRELTDREQCDLCVNAADQLERYKEQ